MLQYLYFTNIWVCQPAHVPDLLAYSSIIVRASSQYVDAPWLSYDAQFCREAATRPGTPWAVIDSSIWTLHFSRATPVPKSEVKTNAGVMYNQPAWKHTKPNSASRFHPYKPQSASSGTSTMVATSRNVHTNMCAFNADHPSTTNSAAQGIQTKQWERAIGTKNFFVPQLKHKLGSKNAHSPNDSNSSIPPIHQHASKEPTGRIELNEFS